MIKSNFKVNGLDFATWFTTTFLPTQAGKVQGSYVNFPESIREIYENQALFPYPIKPENVRRVLDLLPQLTGQASVSLEKFVALFVFIYNETGGRFESMPEQGGEAWYAAHGYSSKSKGRGLIQLTSPENYRAVLSQLGYDYDSLSAEQLNVLFEKYEVYIPATRLYLTDTRLAGQYWAGIDSGKFKEFGTRISGASWYGDLLDARAQALLSALRQASISTPMSTRRIAGISLGVVALLALAYYFRKEVIGFYSKQYNSLTK